MPKEAVSAAHESIRAEPQLLTRPRELSASERARVRGREILFIMARDGHVPQEALKPMARFETAGCRVTVACLDADRVRFDPIGMALAGLEALWDPTLRLMLAARRGGRFRGLPSLRDLERAGQLDAWLARFDAVIVPGGHGAILHDFLRDPLVHATVLHFHHTHRVVGLICHAALIAVHAGESGTALAAGRVMVSWPRTADRVFGMLPLVGRHMVPYRQPVAVSLEQAGATLHDGMLTFPRIHTVVDARLVTARGPWSDAPFATAVLHLLASADAPDAAA